MVHPCSVALKAARLANPPYFPTQNQTGIPQRTEHSTLAWGCFTTLFHRHAVRVLLEVPLHICVGGQRIYPESTLYIILRSNPS